MPPLVPPFCSVQRRLPPASALLATARSPPVSPAPRASLTQSDPATELNCEFTCSLDIGASVTCPIGYLTRSPYRCSGGRTAVGDPETGNRHRHAFNRSEGLNGTKSEPGQLGHAWDCEPGLAVGDSRGLSRDDRLLNRFGPVTYGTLARSRDRWRSFLGRNGHRFATFSVFSFSSFPYSGGENGWLPRN